MQKKIYQVKLFLNISAIYYSLFFIITLFNKLFSLLILEYWVLIMFFPKQNKKLWTTVHCSPHYLFKMYLFVKSSIWGPSGLDDLMSPCSVSTLPFFLSSWSWCLWIYTNQREVGLAWNSAQPMPGDMENLTKYPSRCGTQHCWLLKARAKGQWRGVALGKRCWGMNHFSHSGLSPAAFH